jgi:hypothetical protein
MLWNLDLEEVWRPGRQRQSSTERATIVRWTDTKTCVTFVINLFISLLTSITTRLTSATHEFVSWLSAS